jgi:flavodoxin
MKIGIIVYSFTGNTNSVAQKIQDKLLQAGHLAEIKRIIIKGGEQPNSKQFIFENPPTINKYDALIFGAPVRGFSISPVISTYLKQLSSLKDKKVACFVTKQLNSYWTGGTRAITMMKRICESKGGVVVGTGVVFWKSKNRDIEIDTLAETLSSLF